MISTYLVGSRLLLTAPVTDELTDTLVDPSALTFRLSGPSVSATYAWNGSTWTVSESAVGVPSRASLGTFELEITVPYDNGAEGIWSAGWKSVENGSGKGEGSGEIQFLVKRTAAL